MDDEWLLFSDLHQVYHIFAALIPVIKIENIKLQSLRPNAHLMKVVIDGINAPNKGKDSKVILKMLSTFKIGNHRKAKGKMNGQKYTTKYASAKKRKQEWQLYY